MELVRTADACPAPLRSALVSGSSGIGFASAENITMSYPFSSKNFVDVEPETENPISLPGASRAERNVPRASTAHCTVTSVLGRGDGTRFQSESLLEYRHKLVLNSFGNLVDMREQVRFLYGLHDEREVVFDIYITLDDGTRIACDVKPEKRLESGRHLLKMQEVAWWVLEKDFADEVRLFSEADLDPVELFNALVYSAVRGPDPEADAAALAVVIALEGGCCLRDLTQEIGLQARGYRAILRLLRDRALCTFGHVRITPDVIVTRSADFTSIIRSLHDRGRV